MRLFDIFKTKCKKCPYRLGIVRLIINPCPQCKLNHYSIYYQLLEDKCTLARNRIMEIQRNLEINNRTDKNGDH